MNPDHALLLAWTAPVAASDSGRLAARLSMSVEHVDRETGAVRLRFVPGTHLRDADGSASQVAVAAMLDYALSFAALATVDPTHAVVTSTLRIERVATSSAAQFEAEASVVASNGSTLFVRAVLQDERAAHVALASATLRRTPTRR